MFIHSNPLYIISFVQQKTRCILIFTLPVLYLTSMKTSFYIKKAYLWLVYVAFILLSLVFLFLFPPGLWVSIAMFLIWGVFSIIEDRSKTRELHDIEEYLSKVAELFDLSPQDKNQLCLLIGQKLNDLHDERTQLLSRIQELESRLGPQSQHLQAMDELCPVHIPVDIGKRWDALIDREWGVVNKEALENLNTIKLMNDENQEFITEVIHEFGEHQETFTEFSQKYRINMEEYSKKAEGAKRAVLDELGQSSKKIEETFAQFGQVEDITEKIKMISLNLSIEASKVRGADAFSLLARELRRLAQSTDETIKGLSSSIKNTVEAMNKSREMQVRDLSTMDSILQQFELLLTQYDEASSKLHAYMRRAIDRINGNQEAQKAILLNFFKTLQRIAITKEELEHQIQYYGIFVRNTNDYVQRVLRVNKQCKGSACPQRKAMLEELAKIANTDEERKMVNEFFKELLGEDREAAHGTLVSDSNDFISF